MAHGLAFLMLLLVTGSVLSLKCPGDIGCPCKVTGECTLGGKQPGQVCINGFCQPVAGNGICDTKADCKPNQYCDSKRVCRDDPVKCPGDVGCLCRFQGHCSVGVPPQDCVDGRCQLRARIQEK